MGGTEFTEMGECQPDVWAAQQTILLKLNMANFDRIVSGFRSKALWADTNSVAWLVISVAGSRDKLRDLIGLMTKLAQSRGYSGTESRIFRDRIGIGSPEHQLLRPLASTPSSPTNHRTRSLDLGCPSGADYFAVVLDRLRHEPARQVMDAGRHVVLQMVPVVSLRRGYCGRWPSKTRGSGEGSADSPRRDCVGQAESTARDGDCRLESPEGVCGPCVTGFIRAAIL
jgi:hypothetical protein